MYNFLFLEQQKYKKLSNYLDFMPKIVFFTTNIFFKLLYSKKLLYIIVQVFIFFLKGFL